jgi:hypothetical protein
MRKTGLLLAAVLAITTACKSSREGDQKTPAKQVEQAQNESKEAYDRAKEAQEKAIDEQKDVDKSLEDVNKKRQELTEAQAKAEKQQQESQQAQATAQQEGQAANEQAQAAQARATQQQQTQVEQQTQRQQAQAQEQQRQAQARESSQTRTTPPPARPADSSQPAMPESAAPTGTRSLAHGALDQVSSDEIVIHREGTEALHLKLDANTRIERDTGAATASDLTKGTNVTATYRVEGGQPVAESVHIVQ